MMLDNSQPHHVQPAFLAWLAHNQTGIPRRVAVGRALLGMLLGGLVSLTLTGLRPGALARVRMLPLVGGAVGGSVLGPLAVVFVAYRLDRRWFTDDSLLGFSGVMRELFHAGELSVLGALGGGLGSSDKGNLRGILTSALGTSVLGGVLYHVRGFGAGVGVGAGLLSGAVGGAIGGVSSLLAVVVRKGRNNI